MTASSAVRIAMQRHAAVGVRRHNFHQQQTPLFQHCFHSIAAGPLNRNDDDNNNRYNIKPVSSQIALYHSTTPTDSTAVVLGLGAVSCASFAAAQGVKAWREYKESLPEEPPVVEEEKEKDTSKQSQEQEEEGPRENVFKKWFNAGVGSKYYEGGFEEQMTRREAALILGVRESSTAKRIKEAHRKLLILNHPDTGGSTYMAGKINEAKELLLKGKKV